MGKNNKGGGQKGRRDMVWGKAGLIRIDQAIHSQAYLVSEPSVTKDSID